MVTAERSSYAGIPVLELGRRTRRDALPEHTQYADTGCDVHPSCLTCPLVRCRYDEPGGVRRVYSEDRDRAIVSLQRQGIPIDAIARRVGVSRRTVFRALARARPAVQVPLGSPCKIERQAGSSGRGAHARAEVGGIPPLLPSFIRRAQQHESDAKRSVRSDDVYDR